MNLKENFKGMWIMGLAFAVIFGVFTAISSLERAEEQERIELKNRQYNYQCGLREIRRKVSIDEEELGYILGKGNNFIESFCADPK